MSHSEFGPNLFLVVHDPFSGKLEVDRELLGCGLAAAELAHLLIDGRLDIADDRIVIGGEVGSENETDAFVLRSVARQLPGQTPREWTRTLGADLYTMIADDLVEQRIVRREERRGLVRRGPDRFPAVDLLRASGPRLRLDHMFANPTTFTLSGAVSAALVGAMGIETIFYADVDREFFDELTTYLPTRLQKLMDGMTSAVAAALS